jgi:hypothetical protein
MTVKSNLITFHQRYPFNFPDELDDDDCLIQISRCLRQPLAEDYITVVIDDAVELCLSIDEAIELAAEMTKAAHYKVGSDE